MPNTITLAKNYTSILDEVYKNASVTADLTSDAAMMRAGSNANEIIYPQLTVGGLGDYDRNFGYTSSAVDLKWKTAAFNYDRGAKITVDVMDNEESRNIAFTRAGAELQRTRGAPEADAFTFATICGFDDITKRAEILADATAFLSALIEAKNKMDEDEVPEEGRRLYGGRTSQTGNCRRIAEIREMEKMSSIRRLICLTERAKGRKQDILKRLRVRRTLIS